MQLAELQHWFAEQIINPTDVEAHIQSSHLSAANRMAIYTQQYWQRLLPFLQKDFPTLLRLRGADDFNELIAKPYLLTLPPNHWSLSLLGSRLPEWIQNHYHEEDKILIYQCSLVDESYTRVRTSSPPPEDPRAPIYLQSYVTLLALDADLFTFRKQLLKQNSFSPISWDRKHYFVCNEEINEAQFTLLKAFEKGATLEDACSQIDAGEEIAQWFQHWAERGWFSMKKELTPL